MSKATSTPSPTAHDWDKLSDCRNASKELLTRTEPLSPSVLANLGLDPVRVTLAEMQAGSELYHLVKLHL